MTENVIIIPTRLEAKRLPNKPIKKINNKEMILHVYEAAKKANIGEVIVASPNQQIYELITSAKGFCVKTRPDHKTGTDRIFEVFDKFLKRKPQTIINLQGDMPNIQPSSILKLDKLMRNNKCDIGTLASNIISKDEIIDPNIVKVVTNQKLDRENFLEANDFFRNKNCSNIEKIYHHIGIYAYTNKALEKYVQLDRSKLEVERNLEQMRAMENNMSIKVGLCEHQTLGVDTEQDLIKVIKEMK